MRKTKIICTLGPSTDDPRVLRELMLAGMDVARVNMSHQNHESHLRRIQMIKELREELDLPIAILIDTKGPEIRLGTFREPKVQLIPGDSFTLTTRTVEGDSSIASVSFAGLPADRTARMPYSDRRRPDRTDGAGNHRYGHPLYCGQRRPGLRQ